MTDRSEERIPFDGKNYFRERLKVAPFQHEMLASGAADFSGGYFTRYASPFALFTKNMTTKQYTERLIKYIRGLSDVIFFYYLSNDENMQYRCGLLVEEDKLEQFKKAFDGKVNDSNAVLNPRILINHLNISHDMQNQVLKEEYGFDFEDVAARMETLYAAIKTAEVGDIRSFKRFIIKKGPENMEMIDALHNVIQKFYSIAAVETKDMYVEVAEKIQAATDQSKIILATHIFNATPPERRLMAA